MKKFFLAAIATVLVFSACEKGEKLEEKVEQTLNTNEFGINTDELIHTYYSTDSSRIYFFGAPGGNITIKGFFNKNHDQFIDFTDPEPVDYNEKIFITYSSDFVDSVSYRKVENMLLHEVQIDEKTALAIYYQFEYSNKDSTISHYEYKPHNIYFFENNIFIRKQKPAAQYFSFQMYPWFEGSVIIVGADKNYCYSMGGDEIFSVEKIRNSIGGFVEAINLHECISGFFYNGFSRVNSSGESKWYISYYDLPGASDSFFTRYLSLISKSGNLWTLEYCYNLKDGGAFTCNQFTVDIENGTWQ